MYIHLCLSSVITLMVSYNVTQQFRRPCLWTHNCFTKKAWNVQIYITLFFFYYHSFYFHVPISSAGKISRPRTCCRWSYEIPFLLSCDYDTNIRVINGADNRWSTSVGIKLLFRRALFLWRERKICQEQWNISCTPKNDCPINSKVP